MWLGELLEIRRITSLSLREKRFFVLFTSRGAMAWAPAYAGATFKTVQVAVLAHVAAASFVIYTHRDMALQARFLAQGQE